MTNSEKLPLELEDLQKYFDQDTGLLDSLFGSAEQIKAVDGVSLEIGEGEVKGIIGESGCGKTTLLRTIVGVYANTGGEIWFNEDPISEFDKTEMKQYRRKIPLIFQDPFNALNPRMTVREILAEPLEIHGIDYDEDKITETLERVELRPPDRFLDRVPGQLSGGQRQRVSIGRAIIVDPEIILADEPVSMLDVSTQASILKLLKNLVSDLGIPMIYISHDLSTVSYVCDEINVMYLGRIVERAPKKELLENPKHPYSRELINAVPIPDPYHNRVRTNLKQPAPDPSDLGSGCRFKNRCPKRMEICDETPMDVPLRDNRQVACHLHYDHEAYERSDGGALEDYVTSEKEGGLNDE